MSSGSSHNLPDVTGSFQSLTQLPVTSFITKQVGAPTSLYVRDDAFIQVTVRNINNSGANLTIRTRLLRAVDGQIIESDDTMIVSDTAGNVTRLTVQLTEGFLLSVAVVENTAGIKRGMTFVSVLLCRKLVTNPTIEQILAQDYVSVGSHLAWPGGLIRQSVEGPGSILSTSPPATFGAGAEISFATGSLRRQRIVKLSCTFTTSAAVANRLPQAAFSDGLGTFFDVYPLSQTIPASQVVQVSWGADIGQLAATSGTQFLGCLPRDPYMSWGATFGTKTIALQAGDQYTNVILSTEEWIEP